MKLKKTEQPKSQFFKYKTLNFAVFTALTIASTSALAAIPEGNAAGLDSIAIGDGSSTPAQNGIAIGDNTVSNGVNSVAIGANGSIFNANNLISTSGSILIAPGGVSSANNSVNIGYLGNNYSGNSINLGSQSFIDLNAGAAIAIGSESVSRSSASIAFGYRASNGAAANSSIAIGDQTSVTGLQGVGMGVNASVTGSRGVAIGPTANSSGNNAVSIGNSTEATGSGTFAAANNASALANGAISIGQNSIASGSNSITLGVAGQATSTESISIGAATISTGNKSVAIGADSNDLGLANVVSIGNASLKRRLINVGDGTLSTTSTDAVNGRQLNTTNTNVTTAQTTANNALSAANAAQLTATAADTKATQAIADAAAAQSAAIIADAKAENALDLIAIVDTKASNAINLAQGAQSTADFAVQRTDQIESSLRGIGSDAAYADIGVQYSDGSSETQAAVTVTNDVGTKNGFTVGTTSTMITGGYANQNMMFINDSGFSLGNVLTGDPVALTGVADGVNQYDAVNFGQLDTVDVKATTAITTANTALSETQRIETTLRGSGVDGAVANMGVNYSDGSSETRAQVLVTNSLGNTHGLSVGTTQTTLSGGANSSVMTLDDSGVTFSRQSDGAPVRVTGVADAVSDFDAVNFRQLNDAIAGLGGGMGGGASQAQINQLNSRMDRQDRRMDKIERKAYGGVALNMAMQSTVHDANAPVNFSVGSGIYQGETALAASISIRTDKATVAIGAGFTTAGDFGARASISWAWDPTYDSFSWNPALVKSTKVKSDKLTEAAQK